MAWFKAQMSLQAKLNALLLILFSCFVIAAITVIYYKTHAFYQTRKIDILLEKKREIIDKTELIHQLASEVYQQNSTIEAIEQEYRKKLVSIVNTISSVVSKRYATLKEQGIADAVIQEELKDILRHTRYDGETGYIFTYDLTGTLVSHPDPNLDGQNIYNRIDAKGFYFVQQIIEMSKNQGQGFVHYHWQKLGETQPQLKLSYVEVFKPYNWIIGTGIYIEDTQAVLQQRITRLITMHRYDLGNTKSNYFFILDSAGNVVANPAFPNFNNTNVLDMRDKDGKLFIREILQIADEQNAGFTTYRWYKPEQQGALGEKHTYVKKFLPFDWVIATGVYLEDAGIEQAYQALEAEADEITSAVILIGFAFLLIGGIASLALVNLIVRPLVQARYVAREIAQGNFSVRIPYQTQDEIGQLTTAINSMAQQLQESFNHLVQLNQEKNEFLGIAAHDLKNPLSSIRGYAEDIQESFHDIPPAELVEMARMIETSAKRMFDLITNLLDVNAIESGNINLNIERIDILPTVKVLIQDYQPRAHSKLIDIHLGAEASSYLACVDINAIHQILDNVLSNAIKYSPFNRNVYVRLTSATDDIVCEIEDEGQGVDACELGHIFEKFTRLSPKPTAGEHSTGLGMFIVKTLVERMHGKISCHSEVGKGTTFVLRFPKH